MRILAAIVVATALAAPAGAGGSGERCGPACRAGYAAIAAALPQDRSNVLARAVLRTPGFDFAQLSKALGVPTAREIRQRWRRWCEAHFSRRGAVERCDELILGPPEARGGGARPASATSSPRRSS